jgi:hypothetical protein
MTMFEYCNVLTLSLSATIFCSVMFSSATLNLLIYYSRLFVYVYLPTLCLLFISILICQLQPELALHCLLLSISSPSILIHDLPLKSIILISPCKSATRLIRWFVQFTTKISIFI